MPEGYQGLILEKTDKALSQQQNGAAMADRLRRMEEGEDDEDGETETEKSVEVKTMDQKAKFEEVVVWGHELVPEEDDDYVKGVQEWISFAEAVCPSSSTSFFPSKADGSGRCTPTTNLQYSKHRDEPPDT